MSKKIILTSIIIILILFGIYQGFIREEKPKFELVEVKRGNISQEVSESGTVKKGEEINLSFKTSGKIEKIWVGVGENVKERDILAKLENSQLKIQLKEAKANLEMAQAKLNKLLAGASQEEIQIAKTAVINAQISLEAAKQNLEDVKAQGEENLKSAYEDALNVLNDSYLKIQNSFYTVDLIQRTYFIINDQEGIRVKERKQQIETTLDKIKIIFNTAKTTQSREDIDSALFEMKKGLNTIFDALKAIRETCDEITYKNIVSLTDKTSLDNQRGYINTALTNIVNSQQTIFSTKLTNTANLNTYQSKVDLAQGQLKAAEDELAKVLAPARKENIELYQAQIKQVEAQIQLLESQIEDTILKSPVSGQIIKIKKREGETVQPMLQDVVISLLPDSPFQIKADIYEEDVVKMKVGNPVDISLVSFPDQIFKEKIISIDPAEKLKEGVVYYEITIDFEEVPEGVKPGMTADLVIKVDFKENVLIIPEKAVQKKDNRVIVEVLRNEVIEERDIEIGLRGSDDMVEVISGLNEGEKIILR